MNQILSVEMKKDKKSKSKSSGPVEIKKVVMFFCISIIIFGIGMVGQGSYGIIKNINSNQKAVQKNENTPKVDIQKDGNQIVIKATHDKVLSKIMYHWNDEEEETIEGNGTNIIEEIIDLPVGNNKLTVKVEDVQGKSTIYEQEYVTDATEPQVSIEAAENNKLKIIAKDNTALSYITYRWDEEEETKVEAREDSKAQIEEEIDIPRGQHTLTVVVVNSNNKTITKTQEVKTTTKPKIEISVDQSDPSYIIMSATDENAMKIMRFTINNGNTYEIDYSDRNEKKIEWRWQVQAGDNAIKVEAINADGIEEVQEARYPYNP